MYAYWLMWSVDRPVNCAELCADDLPWSRFSLRHGSRACNSRTRHCQGSYCCCSITDLYTV